MAKEYIEREAAKSELLSWAVSINHPEYLIKDDALHVIDSMPAADVVEAVRCRDCKYSYCNKYCTNEQWKDDGCATVTIEADDFCSYGKRKGGSDND